MGWHGHGMEIGGTSTAQERAWHKIIGTARHEGLKMFGTRHGFF